MAKIKKPFEPIAVKNIKVLIYGQPGIRKTTFAFTAHNSLLIDCDRGIQRLHPMYRKEYVEVDSWKDISTLSSDPDIARFDTIIIDTAGKALDFLAQQIMSENEKLNYQGNLTLQGYGVLKTRFKQWLTQMDMMRKNLIFVAHDREGKDGEQVVIRPDVAGSSLGILVREMDLVGYMESKNNRSSICFDPSDRFYGKNSCQIPMQPDLSQITMQAIFGMYHGQQEKLNDLAEEYNMLMEVISNTVDRMADAKTAAMVAAELEGMKPMWDSNVQARLLFGNRLKDLGLKFNKVNKQYELVLPPPPVTGENGQVEVPAVQSS